MEEKLFLFAIYYHLRQSAFIYKYDYREVGLRCQIAVESPQTNPMYTGHQTTTSEILVIPSNYYLL